MKKFGEETSGVNKAGTQSEEDFSNQIVNQIQTFDFRYK